MKAAVDEILVDLFCRCDRNIQQEFVSLSREEKLEIALRVFQQRGWAEQITDDGDQVQWRDDGGAGPRDGAGRRDAKANTSYIPT